MKNKIRIIGLTGPTGAGKTQVAAIFRRAGIPVLDADLVAREVTQKGSPALAELAAAFSQDILNSDGTLNRAVLAKLAFSSADRTKLLNDITHPHVMANIKNRISELENNGETLAVLDAPLLFESGADALCDKIVAVIAPYECRLERIIKRDKISREQAALRMEAQPDEQFYTEKADYTICNSGNLNELEAHVKEIINIIKGAANEALS